MSKIRRDFYEDARKQAARGYTIHRSSDGSVLFRSKTASSAVEAVSEARGYVSLSGANLSGMDLGGVDLRLAPLDHVDLSNTNLKSAKFFGADLTGAKLTGADLGSADFRCARLNSADLTHAVCVATNFSCADLSGVDMTNADLRGAYFLGSYWGGCGPSPIAQTRGISLARVSPLAMLYEQPGEIAAYKLVTKEGTGPIWQEETIHYEVGSEVSVPNADTAVWKSCGRGISVATLEWCLRNWKPDQRILVVHFRVEDIAAIPLDGSSKWRLHRCKVVAEKDLVELGLGPYLEEAPSVPFGG